VTANSLYGQCGARTSAFYEKDVAASTTATGRKLLFYARSIIENVYGDRICKTKNGRMVATKAEYIYGDSVASYTPIWVRINGEVHNITISELADKLNMKWAICQEAGRETKEVCDTIKYKQQNQTNNSLIVETWSDKGWTPLQRIIRHTLAPHKKMIRVTTANMSRVDVTDDHSLLRPNGKMLSPKNLKVFEDHLMLYPMPTQNQKETHFKDDESLVIDTYEIIDYMSKSDGYVYDLTTENHHFAAGVGQLVVHNTDSVFFTFNLATPDGKPIRGKEALEITIELAQEAGHLASSFLKPPHDLEYEKTFMPFCLLSKKRYVGMLYETDPNKCYRKSMGIVLKRRDNAPVVKDIYGGIIDIIMKENNIRSACTFLRKYLDKLVNEKVPIEKLIITKSLRSFYKNPQSIAHKVLADRIGQRDPGNKPTSGDRIPFVYIVTKAPAKGKKVLQGDRIETPNYIKENNLEIDYLFYITNQIMKPSLQFLELIIDNADRIFKEYIIKEENRKKCMMPMSYYVSKNSESKNDSESENDSENDNNKDSDFEIDKFLEKQSKFVKPKQIKKSTRKTKTKKSPKIKNDDFDENIFVDFLE